LGHFDEQGRLHVLGRSDHVIISGGENVSPTEVEAVLEACPGVLEACVFAVPDPHWGQRVAAALRVRELDAETVLAGAESLAERLLAAFKRPRHYVLATAFVYGPTGKLDRRATAEALRERLRPARGQAERPRNGAN
jgi:acyl-CoA synthetase (AMP-forming)/AMP-acid ligase II